MNAPAWQLHPLKGDLAGHWSVKVNANWRMIFAFEGEDAILVDYLDLWQAEHSKKRKKIAPIAKPKMDLAA